MDLQVARDFLSHLTPSTSGISTVALGFFALLFIGIGVGLLGAFTLPFPRRTRPGVNAILALFLFFTGANCALVFAKRTGLLRPTPLVSLVAWRTDLDAALAEAKAKNLPLLVDFAAEWCTACHEIDRTVFHDARFVEKVKRFVPLRLDVTAETPANEAKLKRFEVYSLPSIVFVRPSGEILKAPRITGGLSAGEFIAIMNQVN